MRTRRSPDPANVLVVALGLVVFLVGFLLFWGVGTRIAGGGFRLGLPDFGGGEPATEEVARSLETPVTYPVTMRFDPVVYRDSHYVPVKGIYISSWIAGSPELLAKQIALVDRTELNAMVIDVKDATGYISYDSNVALADELDLEEHRIKDIDALLTTLREHDIFPIARIVCFNDKLLSAARPEWSVQHKSGGLWRDKKKVSYTNPYDHRVWEYLVELAEDAASRGFREIQFDYVRFPSDGKISDAVYPGRNAAPEDAIAEFLAFARARLEPRGVWVSADVFGLTVHVKDDLGIGQKIEKVARNVDIVSPMIYPSHYEPGSYNIEDPNSSPYETITNAMADSGRRLSGSGAIVRPWLQDFSLGDVTYGVEEVKAQIKAVEDQGYTEWILWDPSVKYVEEALRPE
ncbi:MAG: putative glycoside hydrolase [Thermoleophilia bacterium]